MSSLAHCKLNFTIYLCIGLLLAVTVGFMDGWPLEYLVLQINTVLTTGDNKLMVFFYFFGCAIGPLLTIAGKKLLCQKYTFLVAAATFIVSLLLHAFAAEIGVFQFGKFLSGIAIGGVFVTLPVYIAEIANKRNRGIMVAQVFTFMALGIFLALTLNTWVEDAKVYSLVNLIWPCLFIILCVGLLRETPVQLIVQGNEAEAQAEINRLRGTTFTKDEYEELVETNKEDCSSLLGNRSLIMVLVLMILQPLSGYGYVHSFYNDLIPLSIIQFTTGLDMTATRNLYFVVILITTLFTAALVDVVGRRNLLLISTVGISIVHIFLAIYVEPSSIWETSDDIPLVIALVLVPVFFHIGIGPIPWILMAESLPPNIRTVGSPLCGTVCFIAEYAMYLFLTEENTSLTTTYWIYSFFSVCALIFTFIAIPETKMKNISEIQKAFQSCPLFRR